MVSFYGRKNTSRGNLVLFISSTASACDAGFDTPLVHKTYKSAVDLWLAIILIGTPLAIIFTGVSIGFGLHFLQWHATIGRVVGFILFGFGLALAALIAAFTFPCRYTLREHELNIQCGILQASVPYNKIRRLELSCSLWSAPALSLNRVKIVLDDGIRLISPRNRPEFIRDLQARIDSLPR